jgi:glycosyltransferase involved in cell wall biosynthesis
VLIIVQNLPVPFDRRVWLECGSLTQAGYAVSVVCPKGPGDPSYAVVDGVELYKYRPYTSNGSRLSFIAEFLYSFVATLWLSLKAARRGPFAVVQSCNPPDIFWPIGLLFRTLHGSRFVFDHHDLCPETYKVRYPTGAKSLLRALLFLERRTVRSADHVIATNDSYRELDITRHGIDPQRVTVVRTGPDPQRLKRTEVDEDVRKGRTCVVVYIGVMGPQDGVDIVIDVADVVVHEFGRTDVGFVLIGSGDCLDSLLEQRNKLGLGEFVEFTGRIPDETVAAIMSSADVGISPDPMNSLNEFCTMNKTMEYMAFELPLVAFDIQETRVSAAEAALYAEPNDVHELALAVMKLADDPSLRQSMGSVGRRRIELELGWEHQAPRYVAVYDQLCDAPRSEPLEPTEVQTR